MAHGVEDIDVKINGPGQAEVLKKEQKEGKVDVVYRTLSPGEYDIHIKHKGKAIHGSPFGAKISGMFVTCIIQHREKQIDR